MFKNKFFLKSLIGFTIASIAIMVFAFYSFAPLSEDQLIKVETTINLVQKNNEMRVDWVTFYDENGGKYYCHENLLKSYKSTSAFADILKKEYAGKTLSIYYTDRIDLIPFNIPRFWGFNRVVAIECEDQVLVSLNTYNSVNRELLIVWAVIAVILLMVATRPFVAERIIDIYINRKNKKEHP